MKLYRKIRYYWRIWFWSRWNPDRLFRGEVKRWLLNVIFYKELNFSRRLLNLGYGNLYPVIRRMTDGSINLYTGIVLLEMGIKNDDQYREYVKHEKAKSLIAKDIIKKIREKKDAEKEKECV
jgi:hypothetical protein